MALGMTPQKTKSMISQPGSCELLLHLFRVLLCEYLNTGEYLPYTHTVHSYEEQPVHKKYICGGGLATTATLARFVFGFLF